MAFEERGFVYYQDYIYTMGAGEDDAIQERRRIIMIPAATGDIPDLTPWPAWAEAPAVDTSWLRIPDGALEISKPGVAGYDKLPIGLPDPTIASMRVHNAEANQLAGFVDAITTFSLTVSVSRNAGGTIGVDALNVWAILTDRGDGDLPIEGFELYFLGCQRELPEKKGKIIPRVNAYVDYELIDIGTALTSAITMQDVCEDILAGGSIQEHRIVYDLLWESGESVCGWVTAAAYEEAELYKLGDLYAWMQFLCSGAYERFLRGVFGETSFNFRKPGVDSGVYFGHPYSHITFSQQGYTDDLALPGDAELDVDTEVYYIGSMKLDDSDLAVQSGALIASPKGDASESLNNDRSVYETLNGMCWGTMAKARFRHRGAANLDLWFTGVAAGTRAAKEITLADIIYEEHDSLAGLDYVESASVVANAKGQVRSTGSDDRIIDDRKNFGSKAEQGTTHEITFSNMPSVGDGADDWTFYNRNSSFPGGVGNQHGFSRNIHNWWSLYYLAQPLGATEDIPIRVHHQCTIDHGAGIITTTPHLDELTLPEISADTATNDYTKATLRNSVRAAVFSVQRDGGMLNGIPQSSIAVFGNSRQTSYPLTLFAVDSSFGDLGEVYNLSPLDDAGHYSAQALADNDAVNVKHLFGSCLLLKVEPYAAAAGGRPTSLCTLLGIRY